MTLRDNISYNAIAEAKFVGSEIVENNHLLIAIVKTLTTEGFYSKSDEIITYSEKLQQELLALGLTGIKPPKLSEAVESLLSNIFDLESADLVTRSLTSQIPGEECSAKSASQEITSNVLEKSFGDFHSINGPNVRKLPKIITDRTIMIPLVRPFLLTGEEFLYDGVYNTRDANISTQYGNKQSMGRMIVTNLRLIFWSDDYEKPHIGAFYSDINYWKTSWMPLKSRGIIMNIGGRKIIFAANSNAVDMASRFLNSKQ